MPRVQSMCGHAVHTAVPARCAGQPPARRPFPRLPRRIPNEGRPPLLRALQARPSWIASSHRLPRPRESRRAACVSTLSSRGARASSPSWPRTPACPRRRSRSSCRATARGERAAKSAKAAGLDEESVHFYAGESIYFCIMAAEKRIRKLLPSSRVPRLVLMMT